MGGLQIQIGALRRLRHNGALPAAARAAATGRIDDPAAFACSYIRQLHTTPPCRRGPDATRQPTPRSFSLRGTS